MEGHHILEGVLVLLLLAVATVTLLRRVHLPPILAYLMVGIVSGPLALGWVEDTQVVALLAEVGVVFLLFTIGLEFSIPLFLAMKGAVLGLGGAQVLLTAGLGGGLAWVLGVPWQGALVLGGVVAMSSTAITVKQLTEQLEMHSRHGRLALGVLLFQDLAVVPFLVLIPLLGEGGGQALAVPLLMALLKGAFAFAVMLTLGHYALRPLFHAVAHAHSAELFTLTVLLVSLAAAWITEFMGLSLALGAFLAGMMLGETEYRHQVEADVRPFRDVLMGLFFVAVGMKLDLGALITNWHWVLSILFGLVAGKALLVTVLARLGGYESGVALRTGLVLGQGGEFGFALLSLAMGHGVLASEYSQPILAAIILSMMLAPLVIRFNGTTSKRLSGAYVAHRVAQANDIEVATRAAVGHVIICGFGRIGQNLARVLRGQDVEYVALDLDPTLISEAHEAGEPVFFGDSAHGEILEAAGLARARALVVTFDDAQTAGHIVRAARRRKDLPILVRTRDDAHLEELEEAGATEVVPESVEASMMLATHLLQRLGTPLDEVLALVEKARCDHYRGLRGFYHGEAIEGVEDAASFLERLHTVVLPPNAHAVGRTLAEFFERNEAVGVEAIRRGGIRGDEPGPETRLRKGDALVLFGLAENLEHAEVWLLTG